MAEIYPNPTTGIFRIKNRNRVDKLEVYTLQGQRVEGEYPGGRADISAL